MVKDAKWDQVETKPNATTGVAISTEQRGFFSIAENLQKICSLTTDNLYCPSFVKS